MPQGITYNGQVYALEGISERFIVHFTGFYFSCRAPPPTGTLMEYTLCYRQVIILDLKNLSLISASVPPESVFLVHPLTIFLSLPASCIPANAV